MIEPPSEDADILSAEVRVPEHVVVREFDEESVALNLRTGNYFGLNGVAARMFDRLAEARSGGETIEDLAREYGQDRAVIERDLAMLLRELAERDLVELNDPASPS